MLLLELELSFQGKRTTRWMESLRDYSLKLFFFDPKMGRKPFDGFHRFSRPNGVFPKVCDPIDCTVFRPAREGQRLVVCRFVSSFSQLRTVPKLDPSLKRHSSKAHSLIYTALQCQNNLTLPVKGHPYITSYEFCDFSIPPPSPSSKRHLCPYPPSLPVIYAP